MQKQPSLFNLQQIEALIQENEHRTLSLQNKKQQWTTIEGKADISLRSNHPYSEKMRLFVQKVSEKLIVRDCVNFTIYYFIWRNFRKVKKTLQDKLCKWGNIYFTLRKTFANEELLEFCLDIL